MLCVMVAFSSCLHSSLDYNSNFFWICLLAFIRFRIFGKCFFRFLILSENKSEYEMLRGLNWIKKCGIGFMFFFASTFFCENCPFFIVFHVFYSQVFFLCELSFLVSFHFSLKKMFLIFLSIVTNKIWYWFHVFYSLIFFCENCLL